MFLGGTAFGEMEFGGLSFIVTIVPSYVFLDYELMVFMQRNFTVQTITNVNYSLDVLLNYKHNLNILITF